MTRASISQKRDKCMNNYKKYIVTGILLLVAAVVAYVFGIVFFFKYLDLLVNSGTIDVSYLLMYVLFLLFGTIFGAGGLFLVIFFSIKLHKSAKLAQKQ